MTPFAKRAAGLGALVLVVGAGLVAYRASRPPMTAVADPAVTLSKVDAEDGGTEPVALPATPILKNGAPDPGRLAVDFAYKVGGTTYAYRLGLAFAPDAQTGTMDLGAPRGQSQSVDQFPVERRWSATRKGYLVAVSHDLAALSPPVPSLCVRAVLGPSMTSLDLKEASLCVMQRDETGRCHPTTLACGLIR